MILERLYDYMGQPSWFWPAVITAIFVALPSIAGALEAAL